MFLGWRKNCQIQFRVQFGELFNTSGCLNQRSEINVLRCSTSLKCVLCYRPVVFFDGKKGRKRQNQSPRLFLDGPSCLPRGDVPHAARANGLWLKLRKRGISGRAELPTHTQSTQENMFVSCFCPFMLMCVRAFVWNPSEICSILRWSSNLDGGHTPPQSCGVWTLPNIHNITLSFFLLSHCLFHFDAILVTNKDCLHLATYIIDIMWRLIRLDRLPSWQQSNWWTEASSCRDWSTFKEGVSLLKLDLMELLKSSCCQDDAECWPHSQPNPSWSSWCYGTN